MWPLIMAALGAGKGLEDEKANERDRVLQAKTAQYSPWTHMQPTHVSTGDPMMGDMMSGVSAGLAQGQKAQEAKNGQAMQNAQMDNMNAQTNYWNLLAKKQADAQQANSGQ